MIRDTSAQDRVIAANPAATTRRRTITVGAIALAVVLLLVALPTLGRWLGAERAISAERLRFATVERGDLLRDISVQGRIVAAVMPTLYSQVAGTVTLKTRAGETVQQGDTLAIIDSPELTNELERERATLQELDVEVARQRIASERQQLTTRRTADDAQVTLSAAQREMERAELAWAKKAMSQVEYQRARDELRTAEIGASHAGSDAGLEIKAVRFELQTREHQLARQKLVVADLERRVDELNVRSPVAGVVGTVAVADRAVVPANTALMIVVDLSQLEVEIDVPESYADDLGLGMDAEIRYGNQTYAGKLSAISPEVVESQVTARVRFEDGLPPGMRQNQRVTTRVLMESKPGVLMVQRGPFVDSSGGRFAYVVDGDMATRRPIEVGSGSMTQIEIVSGLQPGERIVISGTDEFEDSESILIAD